MQRADILLAVRRGPRLGRIESPALLATLLIHALAILAATYVARARGAPSRLVASATMALIDLPPQSGGADNRLSPVLAAPVMPSLAAAALVDAPPAPVAVSIASIVAQPAGSPGSSGFDPYAGASPAQLAAAAEQAGPGQASDFQNQSRAGEPLLDAGLAQLRNRLARAAHGLRGSLALQALVASDGIVRDARIVTSSLTPPVSSDLLVTQVRGLKLLPSKASRAEAWLTLPSIEL